MNMSIGSSSEFVHNKNFDLLYPRLFLYLLFIVIIITIAERFRVFAVFTVKRNNLHVLKWLRLIDRNKYKLESRNRNMAWDARVCIEAIHYNHVDILSFALNNGCNWVNDAVVGKSKDPAIINRVDNYYESLRTKNTQLNIDN
jgi:hypothetical protein